MNHLVVARRAARLPGRAALVVLAACLLSTALSVPAALADGPGQSAPRGSSSVGDSYISGEAGRWAGNTNGSSNNTDALGSTAYYDNASNTAEMINRCHRSKSAEVFIGGGVNGKNLACSGAKTATSRPAVTSSPAWTSTTAPAGQGQALMLQNFAAGNNVKMINLSIGGNDFNFASIVQSLRPGLAAVARRGGRTTATTTRRSRRTSPRRTSPRRRR